MIMFYSASFNTFYTPLIHANMPSDVVEITDEQWQFLLEEQGKGIQTIGADVDGFPILVDVPKPDMAAVRPFMKLTFSQLLVATVADEWMSEADGELWLAGTLPDFIQGFITELPVDQQFSTKVQMLKMTTISRLHSIIAKWAAALNKTDEEIDALFEKYSNI